MPLGVQPDRPPRVYGSAISYFTGKLEGYLRYKAIPYERIAMATRHFNRTVPRMQLRRHYHALSGEDQTTTRTILERHGCWEPLWRVGECQSGHDADGRAPFARGLTVF